MRNKFSALNFGEGLEFFQCDAVQLPFGIKRERGGGNDAFRLHPSGKAFAQALPDVRRERRHNQCEDALAPFGIGFADDHDFTGSGFTQGGFDKFRVDFFAAGIDVAVGASEDLQASGGIETSLVIGLENAVRIRD